MYVVALHAHWEDRTRLNVGLYAHIYVSYHNSNIDTNTDRI